MNKKHEKFESWLEKYQPVEEKIYAERERRDAKKEEREERRRAERSRRFGDLCEATEGLAKVVDIPTLRKKFGDDRWVQECLRKYLGRPEWSKLEKLRRKVRRPSYYEAENERRKKLRAERRRIVKRRTLNRCPTKDEILDAWELFAILMTPC